MLNTKHYSVLHSAHYPIFLLRENQQWHHLVQDVVTSSPYAHQKVVVVTDSNLNKHYKKSLQALQQELNNQQQKRFFIYVVKAGESSKSRAEKEKIENFLLKNKFTRRSLMIALGGGVVGDLVGFVAGTFLRGVDYVQVPTSILAMVDAAIGGKTGINTEHGKNLLGLFYRPCAVCVDTTFLDTLPQQDFLEGLAEVIKYGFIKDRKFATMLLHKMHSILIEKDKDIMLNIIKHCIVIKNEVVSADEKELTSYRQILNFGHTIAHAIENVSLYRITHGMAVATGMAVEAYLARQINILSNTDFLFVINLLKSYDFSIQLPPGVSHTKLVKAMLLDKKNDNIVNYNDKQNNAINFALICSIGVPYQKSAQYSLPLPYDFVLEHLAGYKKESAVLVKTPIQ